MNAWGLSGEGSGPARRLSALDDRQRAVLRCLARGLADHEIACVLAVSRWEVESVVAEILRVLDLRDRMAAVVFAHETGLIRLPVPVLDCRDSVAAGSAAFGRQFEPDSPPTEPKARLEGNQARPADAASRGARYW